MEGRWINRLLPTSLLCSDRLSDMEEIKICNSRVEGLIFTAGSRNGQLLHGVIQAACEMYQPLECSEESIFRDALKNASSASVRECLSPLCILLCICASFSYLLTFSLSKNLFLHALRQEPVQSHAFLFVIA